MEELYIDDNNFYAYKEKLDIVDTAVEMRLTKIINILQGACDAVSEGNFHDNLLAYVELLGTMKGRLNEFTEVIKADIDVFCDEMYQIDNSL